MKLTMAKRHEIYKKALDKFIESPDYLCMILYPLLGLDKTIKETLESLPEFAIKKPKGVRLFWWPVPDGRQGNKIRIEILKQCIRETAPKKYSRQSKKVK